MPIHRYKCQNGHVFEKFYRNRADVEETCSCQKCQLEATKTVPLIAKTSTGWGDQTGKFGVNGYYSYSMGKQFQNDKECRVYAESKGFAPASEFDKYVVEDAVEDLKVEQKEYETWKTQNEIKV